MPYFNQRLKELRLKKALSQQALADKIGISKSSINMYERGEREPSIETLEAFADFFNVDMNYLLGKNALFDLAPEELSSFNPREYFSADTLYASGELMKGISKTRIPVLGYVAAGIPIEAIEDILDYEELSPALLRAGGEYFALRIKGASMEPKFSDGDVVIVRKQADVDSGQIAIVCVNGDRATCKKVMKQSSGILLQPLNPTFETTFYTTEQIESIPITIIGRVVELRAKF